ncbi:hypothetical protein [Nitrosospira sp. Nsp13]|uniref:hypothetical protein n=1 Tax=Nitrosospira sp. Nsp13 TaxID=1855332 RepID=UPI000882BA42|nr:hypothetical protein [Nitrosospira sp. Nsp13]SCX86990.1 hypothetical protein SAMN05216308_101645 [Nitrosospira sp. Nsp13]
MANIIAGRFETKEEADSAASSLANFAGRDNIFIFFNNQPGAHDSDHDAANEDDEGAAKGAATGAASGVVVGATIGTLVGGPAGGGIGARLEDTPARCMARRAVFRKKAKPRARSLGRGRRE